MSIRFSKDYENKIRSSIKNYNTRVKRALDAGVPKNRLPELAKISEFKYNYTSKREMDKALARLDRFTRDSTNKTKVGEINASKWKYDYLRNNKNLALDYFQSEYDRVNKRVLTYPGERMYLNNISAKIDVLKKKTKEMEQYEFDASVSAVNEFMHVSSQRTKQYRGFLHEVDVVMDVLDIPETDKKKFFKKFEVLTPSQFFYAYDNSSLISRVYELYFKRDEDGEVILNTDGVTAKKLINSLMEEADDIITDALVNAD